MRTMFAALAATTLLVLAGCGGDGAAAETAAPTSTEAPPSVDPKEYADEIVTAFRAVHPPGGAHYDAPTSDWSAFVSVVKKLDPPEDEALDHERMVAGFEAYVDLRQERDSLCAGVTFSSPGWARCYDATSTANDAWTAALDRAYEIPGLSYATLIS